MLTLADDPQIGRTYYLEGLIENGHRTTNGIREPFFCRETVSRKIVNIRENRIYTECGRAWVRDQTKVYEQ